MIPHPAARRPGRRAVRQRVPEVLLLQDLTEPFRPPVGDQELDPGPVPEPPVAVVAEHRHDARPHLADLVGPDERAQPLADHRVGGQAAADPQVVAGLPGRGLHAHEGHVVDLVHGALGRAAAHHRLELAGQVGEGRVADVAALHLLDLRGRVEDLACVDPGQRAAQDDAGSVPAGLRGGQADRLEQLPDLRDALDLDPVQLDVLPVGDVGGAAGEPAGDVADDVQLLAGQLAAVNPDAEHEVAVVQLLGLQDRGLAAVDARLALGVQAEPAEPATQIGRVDRIEAALGVDVDDPLTDVQPVVVLLVFLVLVERLAVAERPLTFAAGATGRSLSGARWHAAGVLRLSGGAYRSRRRGPVHAPRPGLPGSAPARPETACC